MIATRVKSYGPNFALFFIDDDVDAECHIVDSKNRVLDIKHYRCRAAAWEIGFTGWAKGKTGQHKLNAPNTETIVVQRLRINDDGKVDILHWRLVDQQEKDRLYSQIRAFNI